MDMKTIAALLGIGLAAGATAGNVWWVDCKNGADGDGRGTTEATAFRTIQAAVNAAGYGTGDEIRVKPGVYDDGGDSYNGWNNRILINGKVLKIVSTGGKDVTHITGSGTRRCICFCDAAGSVVEGFTIRDGAATYPTGDALNGRGGGIVGITVGNKYSTAQGCVVDCVISNCVGVRGGAFAGATAVRCWITENSASNSGAAGRITDFVNCLVTRNTGAAACIYESSKIVNCTVVDNERMAQSTLSLYNSVIHNNSNGTTDEYNVRYCSLDHCVTRIDGYYPYFSAEPVASVTNSSPLQFIAPLYDDFRVLKGSDAETAGDASLIDAADLTVPAGVDLHKDLFGNAIPATGTIAAGCIQTVVEPQGGAILFSGRRDILTRGKMTYGKELYAFAETWPTQFVVQAVNKGDPAICCFLLNGAYVFPTMDDTVNIVPPAAPGVVYTNSVEAARATYYVDPVKGSDDTANGQNAETPYKTLQAVVTACGSAFGRVVRAAAGDYREGGEVQGGITNRVWFRGNGIRVIGAGAGKSVIWGAPDPSTGGMGRGATRCVYSVANRSCIQGFTLRDGYADGSTSGDNTYQRGGGVCYDSSTYSTRIHVTDCIITNCWARRGGAGYSGAYERCRITDCHSDVGVMRYATIVSCVVENLHGSEMQDIGNRNSFGLAYCTTFAGRNTDEYVVTKGNGTTFTNCIVMTTKELQSGTAAAGSIAWDVPTFTATDGFTFVDPKLADVAKGDYRPTYYDRRKQPDVVSPALGGGVWFDLSEINVTDFEGRPLNLAGGRPTVGAYQWPLVTEEVAGIYISFR